MEYPIQYTSLVFATNNLQIAGNVGVENTQLCADC